MSIQTTGLGIAGAFAATAIAVSGCKSVQRGLAQACIPNEQVTCSCGATPGAQACREDGSGYEPCDCSGSGTGGTGAAGPGSGQGGDASRGSGTAGHPGGGASGAGGLVSTGPTPVAHFSLDEGTGETILDASGIAPDGTVFGASWTPGIRGTALTFDGADDYVQIPQNEQLIFEDGVTLECWVRLESLDDAVIAGAYRVNAQFDDAYWLHVVDGAFRFSVIGENEATEAAPAPDLAMADTWYHLAGTFDGVEARLFVDGDLAHATTTSFSKLVLTSSGLGLGNEEDGGDVFPLMGTVDEVRLFDVGLSPEEILASFQSMTPTR